MQSSKSQKHQPQTPTVTSPASAARYKKQKLINQIKVFDIENSKLKRLGLSFSEEKLEQAKQILDNFKQKKQKEQGLSQKKKEDSEDSSSSENSEMLDNLTENSRYSSLNEFQNVVRDKIIDIKVSERRGDEREFVELD